MKRDAPKRRRSDQGKGGWAFDQLCGRMKAMARFKDGTRIEVRVGWQEPDGRGYDIWKECIVDDGNRCLTVDGEDDLSLHRVRRWKPGSGPGRRWRPVRRRKRRR